MKVAGSLGKLNQPLGDQGGAALRGGPGLFVDLGSDDRTGDGSLDHPIANNKARLFRLPPVEGQGSANLLARRVSVPKRELEFANCLPAAAEPIRVPQLANDLLRTAPLPLHHEPPCPVPGQ
ncbi:MAG: hypothetical protein AABZ12_10860 [Planctomycetota bacterium]